MLRKCDMSWLWKKNEECNRWVYFVGLSIIITVVFFLVEIGNVSDRLIGTLDERHTCTNESIPSLPEWLSLAGFVVVSKFEFHFEKEKKLSLISVGVTRWGKVNFFCQEKAWDSAKWPNLASAKKDC